MCSLALFLPSLSADTVFMSSADALAARSRSQGQQLREDEHKVEAPPLPGAVSLEQVQGSL